MRYPILLVVAVLPGCAGQGGMQSSGETALQSTGAVTAHYCSGHGPITASEAADASDLIPCPPSAACVQSSGGGVGVLPDGAQFQGQAGWACVVETGCNRNGGDAGVVCVTAGYPDQ
jgi:hypothetical protein